MNIFKIIGIFGLVLIIIGVLVKQKNRMLRDVLYIIGGLALTVYSISIKEALFIVLQIVFTLAALYDLIRLRGKGAGIN